MPMTLVRRPRAARVQHEVILREVRTYYDRMGDDMIDRLQKDIATWDLQPKFRKKVSVSRKKWSITVAFDRRTKAGKVYNWVDKGTGKGAGGSAYDIRPKRKGGVLSFMVPHKPKSVASPISGYNVPGIVMASGNVQQENVITKKVTHPGITPRNFTLSLKNQMKDRNRPGGFKSVSDAAIKRGLRQLGVYS